jgi:Tol biopolymer transport system component
VAAVANRDKGRASPAPRTFRAARAAGALLLAFSALLAGGSRAVAQVPPNQSWKSFETEHFRVTFPEGLDSLALVAGARAEHAWLAIARSFLVPPVGHTELLITDHADFSNGAAAVTPYRRITIYARPPVDGFSLSHFDDWVELVVVHELQHVFQLDQGGALPRMLRAIFGRVPSNWPFFPQHTVPRWVIEGMATWYESALTESGRVRGTQQETELRAAMVEGDFEDLGQASGLSPVWPGGSRPYIYGAHFFDYLARTYGDEHLAEFVRAVGGAWIPYRLNAAARSAFGVSFSRAWADWERSFGEEVNALAAKLARHAPLTQPTPVTRGARQALYAQISPDGEMLLFARSDGKSDTQLRRADPDGANQAELVRTNGLSAFSWLPDGGVVFTEFEIEDIYRVVGDVHVLTTDGDVRRVTDDARLDHPGAAPDGRTVVAVRTTPGATELVEVDLTSGAVRALAAQDPVAEWAFPRVSPDGRWIAASRWLPGAYFDVVILDRSGRQVAEVTHDRALDLAPSWSADGRWLVWESDRSGVPNVMGVAIDPTSGRPGQVRQVTNMLTGAAFPSVDPRGRWIYFSVNHSDGFDVERIAFDPTQWIEPFPEDPRFRADEPLRPAAPLQNVQVHDYQPLHTLRPRFWEPVAQEEIAVSGRTIIGTAVGFRTFGEDLVGRHRADLSVVKATSGAGGTDATVAYTYQGFGNPLLTLAFDQFWDADGPFAGRRSETVVDTLWTVDRQRELSGSMTLRAPGFRTAAALTLGGAYVWEDRTLLNDDLEPETFFRLPNPSARLADARASLNVSRARSYAFSNGAADGASLLLQARKRVQLDLADSLVGNPAGDRGYEEVTGRVLAFKAIEGPGYGPHVLALRAVGGAARGPGVGVSHFRIGGATGGRDPITGYALLGASYLFPVRGYANGVRGGRYAASFSAEYRLPMFLLNRGLGAIPFHFDRTSASLFVDGGNAWTPGEERERPLLSSGAELLAELLVFWNTPVTVRVGVGFPFVDGDFPVAYVRFGRSF